MQTFFACLIVGILAQLVDGTLGMAYGVVCSSFLRGFGLSSAFSSACVHIAEIFTALVSGVSHLRMKNTNFKLVLRLAVPGVVGGFCGAYLLTSLDDALSPFVSVYLIVLGFVVLRKAFRKEAGKSREIGRFVYPLAFVGGLSDCIGGGGWGPIVTSTLVASDHDVRKTVGSVNTAEFFVALAESVAFFFTLGSIREFLPAVGGLIVGGALTAPFAAYLCKKVPVRPLLVATGLLIVGVNAWKLLTFLT